MTAALAYTLAALALYLAADWILVSVERARGAPLPERSVWFFFILLGLALATFWLLRRWLGGP